MSVLLATPSLVYSTTLSYGKEDQVSEPHSSQKLSTMTFSPKKKLWQRRPSEPHSSPKLSTMTFFPKKERYFTITMQISTNSNPSHQIMMTPEV